MSIGPPPWEEEAVTRLVCDVTVAALAADEDPGLGRQGTIDALSRFYDTIDANTPVDLDRILVVALDTICRAAYQLAPAGMFGDEDGPMGLVMEDPATGQVIQDPDAELAEDPDHDPSVGRGVLSAMRFFTAVANDDTATALALFRAVAPVDPEDRDTGMAAATFVVAVLEYAAGILAGVARAAKGDPAADAPVEPAPAERDVRHDPATGLDFVPLPIDPRDRHPDDRANIAPHGDVRYALTLFRYGPPGHRDATVATSLAALASAADRAGETLCGVRHDEDTTVDRIPHSARRHARRALRDAARRHGGTWGLARVWQHYGTCPDDSRSPSDLDVPLFDIQDGAA